MSWLDQRDEARPLNESHVLRDREIKSLLLASNACG